MKKTLILLLMFLAVSVGVDARTMTDFPNGVKSFGVPVLPGSAEVVTGNVFFVDSGNTDGSDNPASGQDMDTPFLTIDYAIGQTTANNGDVIYVLPGHTENITSATSLVIDVAGVTVKGLGNLRTRPTLTLTTSTAASIVVSAANVIFDNFVIDMTGLDAIAVGMTVTGDGFQLLNSEVITADSAGQATRGISFNDAARSTIQNCSLVGSSDVGTSEAIYYSGTTATHNIISSSIVGSFSPNAGIYSSMAQTDVTIKDVDVQNYQDTRYGIQFTAAALGKMINARVATNAITNSVDKGSLITSNIVWYDDDLIANDIMSTPVFDNGGERTIVAKGVSLVDGTVTSVFTITSGPIEILSFVAEFITAASANSVTFTPTANPTRGADTHMAFAIDLNALTVNSFLTIDGTIANAVVNAIPGTALPLGIGMDIPLVIPEGVIDFTLSSANLTTGDVDVYMRYKPLAPTVSVTTRF